MEYATDIRVLPKGINSNHPRAAVSRHASTRHLSDKEIEAAKKECMIGFDPLKFEIKEY